MAFLAVSGFRVSAGKLNQLERTTGFTGPTVKAPPKGVHQPFKDTLVYDIT